MTLPPLTAADLKELRASLGLLQAEFAARFQVPLGTLQNWEQGHREIGAVPSLYLRLIQFNPDNTALALQWIEARHGK